MNSPNTPFKIIAQTSRLYLREFIFKDAQSLFELNNDPLVIQYTGDVAFISLTEAAQFISTYDAYQKTGMGRWAVIRKQDDEFLGWCGLKLENGNCDIGFRFFRKFWNTGYATEAASKCLEIGLTELKMDEIIGRALKENIASIKVLEKIGLAFSHEFEAHGTTAVWYSTKT
ncbi:GNAT family N-acetyltransferase [Flavobacterium silvaticum]|uniref:GNAT family N-acetyltransferase n=1 Tax=Flavobacterium silvaticum TaxID=1852020 RepID=A0A972FZZ9_9FLAO|nr:GNAT family N-acetyltransferase [Flavobacterium silvaticum]NMH27906.1 GNAT family N-acetyltransferase [Flavobacterium silvaticum]